MIDIIGLLLHHIILSALTRFSNKNIEIITSKNGKIQTKNFTFPKSKLRLKIKIDLRARQRPKTSKITGRNLEKKNDTLKPKFSTSKPSNLGLTVDQLNIINAAK